MPSDQSFRACLCPSPAPPFPQDIENAVLTVSVPSPFQLDEQSILILSLHGSGSRGTHTPLVVHLTIYLPDSSPAGNSVGLLPTSLSTTCIVAYTNPSGEPLTTKTTFLLPLALAGRHCTGTARRCAARAAPPCA